jgi:hypothetical protein
MIRRILYRRLRREIGDLWADAATQQNRAVNITTQEYFYGKQTALEQVLGLLR